MKKLTLTLALILSTIMSFSQTKDSEGHILIALWKDYYKAEKADKPQDQLAALDAIKKEAASKHLAWDFYDAASRCVSVRSNVNWKDRSAAQADFSNEITQMGEPVAEFFSRHHGWDRARSEQFVRDNKESLQSSFNPEFHRRDGDFSRHVFSPALLKFVKNDYEYALWSIFNSVRSPLLKEYFGSRYPEAALVEYAGCTYYSDSVAYSMLGELENKYSDKAVGLLARDWRLGYELSLRRMDKSSTSSDYEALRDRCKSLGKEISRLSGDERLIADCCHRAAGVLEELESRSIGTSVEGREATLTLRNVKSLELTVKSGTRALWSTTVTNKKASYYLQDIVKVTLPDFDDGEYDIECKAEGCSDFSKYVKYTLSIATRAIDKGYGAFVADYYTGEPVAECNFGFLDADGKLKFTVGPVAIDGFTQLPEKIQSVLSQDKYADYSIRASLTGKDGRLRLSESVNVRSPHPGISKPLTDYPYRRAVILTDRGAYNPGEILHFKAVLYTGTYSLETFPAGRPVKVVLTDPQNNEVGVKELKTNEFGSVEGSFGLTSQSRGGMFSLRVEENGSRITSTQVRVDEFVLPTFDLVWDGDDMMYFPGDIVRVSGKVAAYSGHNLGDARVYYSTDGYGSGDISLKPDGSFSFDIPIPVNPSRYGFGVTVTVADATGETQQFSTWKNVNYRIPISAELENTVDGRYRLSGENRYWGSGRIIRDNFARVNFSTAGVTRKGLELYYEILDEAGKTVLNGSAEPNSTMDLDLSGKPSGLYKVKVKASARRADGELETNQHEFNFVKAEDTDTALDMDAVYFFKELGGEDIALQFGSTDGPVWAVVELVGSGNVLLERQMVNLKGVRGLPGSLATVSYQRKADWPESLTLSVLFFHKGECHSYSRTLRLPVIVKPLPLSFTRFTDLARPGEQVSLLISTEPGIECAATVFDKATETIEPNEWSPVRPQRRPEPCVSYDSVCGFCGSRYDLYYADELGIPLMKAAGGRVAAESAMATLNDSTFEEAGVPDVHVRDNFGATMAWEPMLRSDENGNVELRFSGADRLSTYYVQLFAHGAGMKNAVLRREMKVSIPVKAALAQPLFLYGGDEYVARATLSSSLEVPVSGRVSMRFYNGSDYKTSQVIGTASAAVTVPAGGSVPFEAAFDVPADVPVLGVLLNYVSDNKELGSDAVFVTIPVKTAMQTLTEAHSAVFLAGMDKDALIAGLRSEFVNADAASLVPVERDILAMLREAIPESVSPKSTNVLSLTEAYYSNVLARRLGAPGLPDEEMASLMDKIVACQNASGGIAWFEGMESSPVVTAAVLQRIASMPEADSSGLNVEAAVKYLDSSYFDRSGQPWWCGSVSLAVYLQTRALYPGVTFDKPASAKVFREFKKSVKEYLTPSKARGLNAQILAKARRLRTLQSLLTLDGGKQLAKSWGLSLCRKVSRSYDADVESLLQYAVKHRCGGYYYPNAVMPWRGLMESELYAHALLCDLFTVAAERGGNDSGKPAAYAALSREVAEGIRLWIMIQKETQQWEKDAAYIEAIASVMRGTPATLATRVILLSTTFSKPFAEIKASGNGFTVSREFSRGGAAIGEGDILHVGDVITARYKIWSEENRSFVRLTSPRSASLRPAQQLSGHIGWMFRPMSYGSWSFSPQGYRNVLSDKTEYWFDSYPEEHTVITEEFYVTQEGRFQIPAVEIESLYAPHYRANDNGRAALVSE